MAVGKQTYLESDGKALHVTLNSSVEKDQIILAEGWIGITGESGDSGEEIAISVDNREYQLTVPTALDVAKGDIIYLTIANVTGNTFNDNAYSKTAGAGKIAAFKATAEQDANDVVLAIMIAKASLLS